MTTKNLTEKVVERARYFAQGDRRCVIWDSEVSGFGVRIYPSKRKSFVVMYRSSGRKRLHTIGSATVVSLKKAREIAKKRLLDVIEGRDPQKQRKIERAVPTLREFEKRYCDEFASHHKKSWEREHGRYIRNIEPTLGACRLDAITKDDCRMLHRKISAKALTEANRCIELLAVMWEKAKDWGFVTGENPARKIDLNKEDSRERFLTKAEMPKIAEALDEEAKSGSLYAAKLVWLLLLTGCRRDELRLAKWNQVDLETSIMVLPHTKNRTTHRLPLSEAARAILEKLPREEGNPYIFPPPLVQARLVKGDFSGPGFGLSQRQRFKT